MQLHATFKHFRAAALVSLAVCVASPRFLKAQDAIVPPPAGVDPEGVETLTRGPVHEAFAAPTANDPQPNAAIPKKPPVDIDEVQPDFRPEGAIWINGYWEWDAEAEDFIWISGLWRVPPPEMRWVPPYWTEVEGGWQRVAGFWVSTSAGELEYREVPPNSLEVGPSSPAPADNYFYIPGTWSYYDTGYRWRSGYWSPYREDFVWCPSRWIWTPAGCLYQSGYWDHRPLVRAQYFAPVRFTSQVYLQPGFRYRPWCVVDSSRFFVHLWIGPRANCYHFGNYYGSYASRFGYTPWCNWNYRSRHCYDPLWSWCNTHYRRQGIDYIGRCRGWNEHFDRHEHERPARTWKEQTRLIADAKLDPRKSQRVVAADLADVVKRDDNPIRLTKLDARERESIVKVSDDMRKLNVERLKVEREARVAHIRDDKVGDDDGGGKPGRTPRINLAKPSGDGVVDDKRPAGDKPSASPSADIVSGDKPTDGKPNDGKPNDDKPDSGKGQLSSRGGEAKKTAKLKLPEQSDAIREVTRNSRPTSRGRESGGGEGLKETTINLPKQSEGRPRINLDRGAGVAGGTAGAENAAAASSGDKPSNSSSRSRTARSTTGTTAGPELKPPQTDLSAGSGGEGGPRSRGSSGGPKVELPKSSSAGSEGPKIESRSRESRGSQPRIETPKIELPKNTAPKIESRSSQPRISVPSSSSGGSDGPRMESRSRGSSGSQSRTEAPKFSAPRIESQPRSAPRIEMPRSSGSSQSRSMSRPSDSGSLSRPSAARSSGGNSNSGSGGGSSRSRSRSKDD